jgi:hypothetical protein
LTGIVSISPDDDAIVEVRASTRFERRFERFRRARQVKSGFVSELCQMSAETAVKHRDSRGHFDAIRAQGIQPVDLVHIGVEGSR